MAWKLAPALAKLQSEANAKWPNRSKSYDGTIGDAAHSARKSEHNPNRVVGDDVPDGYVTAMDITATDPKIAKALLATLIGDDRVWYCIHDGKIYSRTHDWATEDYEGANAHEHHVHVSLRQTKKACDSTAKWFAAAAPKPPKDDNVKPYPSLKRGDVEPILVPFLKRYFGLDHINDNELFGSGTEVKVKSFQRKNKLVVDGVVGPKTWAAIKAGGTLLPPGWSL